MQCTAFPLHAYRSLQASGTKPLFIGFLLVVFILSLPRILTAAGPAPVDLGSAAHFTILAGAAVTTTGDGVINGDVGASPISGSAIHLTQAQVNGIIYAVDAAGPAGAVIAPALLTTAKGDLTTAFNDAAGRSPIPSGPFRNPGAGNIGGLNLAPASTNSTARLRSRDRTSPSRAVRTMSGSSRSPPIFKWAAWSRSSWRAAPRPETFSGRWALPR